MMTAARWAGLAGLLLLLGAAGSAEATVVRLFNGTFSVQAAECTPTPDVVAAQDSITFSLEPSPARADFTQAYVCPDGVSLCSPLSVLESYATIEANNSYIALAPNETAATEDGLRFVSMDVQLVENNTLAINGVPNATFDQSTIRLRRWNWFTISNSSVYLHYSRINFTDHFTWAVQDSYFKSNYSVLEHGDVAVYVARSEVELNDLTWFIYGRAGGVDPGLYGPRAAHGVWLQDSSVSIYGSDVVVSDAPFIVANSTLFLVNTTLRLYNSSLSLWGSTLDLTNSTLELYNGASLTAYCNSTFSREAEVVNASISGTPTDMLTGALGSSDVTIQNAPSATINLAPNETLAGPAGAVVEPVPAPEPPAVEAPPEPAVNATQEIFAPANETVPTGAENATVAGPEAAPPAPTEPAAATTGGAPEPAPAATGAAPEPAAGPAPEATPAPAPEAAPAPAPEATAGPAAARTPAVSTSAPVLGPAEATPGAGAGTGTP